MANIKESIDVQASASICFEHWMDIENFPKFMHHIKSVTHQNGNIWHWVVDGPIGSSVEWDAEVVGKSEDHSISWHSTSKPLVTNQGEVTFEELSSDLTKVTATIQYEPPAGLLGEKFAQLFSNPNQMVKDSLFNFKDLIENHVRVYA